VYLELSVQLPQQDNKAPQELKDHRVFKVLLDQLVHKV
jgi:hypothetical protein